MKKVMAIIAIAAIGFVGTASAYTPVKMHQDTTKVKVKKKGDKMKVKKKMKDATKM